MKCWFGTCSRKRSFALSVTASLCFVLGCDAEQAASAPRPNESVVVTAKIDGSQPPSSKGKGGREGPVDSSDPHTSPESAREAARSSGIELGNDAMSGLGAIMSDRLGMSGFGLRGRASTRRDRSRSGRLGPTASIPWLASQPNTERYAHRIDNLFQHTKDSPLSTFSIDVDTASYANVRRFLRDGILPPADAVRIEELVNYFSYAYPEPKTGDPVSVTAEATAAPWAPEHRLLRIGLKTRGLDSNQALASNLVFLIDVSGSMADDDKLPLLKRGLSMLAQHLRTDDRVALVVYAGASGLVLPSTSGARRSDILAALERLDAGGSTNGADGIRLAYRIAKENFVKGGTNRVILATDGDFNVGATSEGELVRLIEHERKSGVFLTVLGFGRGNLNDSGMEALADHGNGSYAYIDSIAEAHKVLVRQAGSTLVTVAKDVKLQIEWNPARVASYRLIGYENRMLAARDFNDDTKDAGELGAGHTVTALYEIEAQTAGAENARGQVDPLKYQAQAPTVASMSDELMTLKIRYKSPSADASRLMTTVIRDTTPQADASTDLRWAAAVTCFGMLLRGSALERDANLDLCNSLARSALGADPDGQRHELVSLIEEAKQLGLGTSRVAADALTH